MFLRLPSDKIKWMLVLECIIFINYFQTETVRQNQITTVFDPEYERVVNLDGYDQIQKYYLCMEDYNTDDNFDDAFDNDNNSADVISACLFIAEICIGTCC